MRDDEPISMIGTEELEKGLRASRASAFATIACNAALVLLVFNGAGLERWAQMLPSHPVSIWVAERAADWHKLMQVSPAEMYESIRQRIKVE